MNAVSNTYEIYLRARYASEERRCRALTAGTVIGDRFKRVYLYHMRKTGGTSIYKTLLASGGEETQAVYRRLVRKPNNRVISGGRVFVGWRKFLLEGGVYYFGYSHLAMHELTLPPDTLAFTCLRDPLKRVFSHYKMLVNYVKNNNAPAHIVKTELKWLGGSMDDFLDNLPRRHLTNQLFMFSKKFDVDEAYDRISSLPLVIFAERFDEGLAQLSAMLGIALQPRHDRRTSLSEAVSPASMERLREMLEPEYRLYERLQKSVGAQ